MIRWLLLCLVLASPAVALELQGTPQQGGLVIGKVAPLSQVWLETKSVQIDPDGYFVIGFGRDAPETSQLLVRDISGNTETHSLDVRQRQFNVQRIDGLEPSKVTPPPEVQARRNAERARVKAARAHNSLHANWRLGFVWPSAGRISGVYGSQRILNGKPRWPHYGIDIAAPTGTPVVAPAGGIVRLADPDFYLEGGIVIIDHGFGVSSTMFHLHSVNVVEGQSVARGDLVGTVGSTGRSTGPHVDWRLNWGDVRIDPGTVAPSPAPPAIAQK